MYTIRKLKTIWIIKFNKRTLKRLTNAHRWVYPAFWSHLTKRLLYQGSPEVMLHYDQQREIVKKQGLKNFGFSQIKTQSAEFFLRGLNSTMCGDIGDHLDAIEDFANKYLAQE